VDDSGSHHQDDFRPAPRVSSEVLCENREAVAALFVSPDTNSTHLRHAFTKLGIRSRVELTRLAPAPAPAAVVHESRTVAR
jgi:regulatory LuxR family protein